MWREVAEGLRCVLAGWRALFTVAPRGLVALSALCGLLASGLSWLMWEFWLSDSLLVSAVMWVHDLLAAAARGSHSLGSLGESMVAQLLGPLGTVLFTWLPALAGFVLSYFWWAITILAAVGWLVMFTLTHALLAAPLHAALADELAPGPRRASQWGLWVRALPRELRKALGVVARLALWVAVCAVLLQLLLVAPLLALAFCARSLAWHYFDYVALARGLPPRHMRSWRNLPNATGYVFGLGVALASLIPVVHLLAPAAAVCGAASCRFNRDALPGASPPSVPPPPSPLSPPSPLPPLGPDESNPPSDR